MKEDTIALNNSTTSDLVLERVHAVLDRRGYYWEPQGVDSVLAHQGGKPVQHRNGSARLLLGVLVRPGSLVLSQQTTGMSGYLVNLGPTFQLKIANEFRHVRNAIAESLSEARMTA